MNPGKMLLGTIAMGVVLALFAYLSTEGRVIHNFKRQYPVAGVIAIIFGGCFVTYTLGSLLVFLLGIFLPFTGESRNVPTKKNIFDLLQKFIISLQ